MTYNSPTYVAQEFNPSLITMSMYLLDKASKITIIFEISHKISVLPRTAMLPFLKLETHIGTFKNLFGGGKKVDKQGSDGE